MSIETRRRGGFTLIELLVVVSVIALLIGMLLPSLKWSREVAQSMVGSSNVRQLSLAQIAYSSDHDGWLAGANTTGLSTRLDGGDSLEGSTSDVTPTSTFDWISPTLGGAMGFSANRAQRTRDIFERYACPKSTYPYTVLYAETTPGDLSEFQAEMTKRPYLQLSYLSPAAFHCVPGIGGGALSTWKPRVRGVQVEAFKAWNSPFESPITYRPRLDLIKAPSTKIAVADGTRYVEYRGGRNPTVKFDFDVNPAPSIYGSFLTASPAFHRCTEYGRAAQNAGSNTFHIDLSMRFFGKNNEMHIAHWDGHATRIDKNEAWSNPAPWYPRGSKRRGADATPEIDAKYEDGDELP